MEKNKYISIDDLLNLVSSLYQFFIRKLKVLIICAFISSVLGFVYAYFSKPIYKGYLSFMLNESEGPSLNLSSIATLAGLGGASMSGGGGVNEDKMLFLSNSKFLIGSTLLSEIPIDGKNQLLINYYIDKYELQKGFKSDTLLADFTYFKNVNLDSLTTQENKVIDNVIKFFDDSKMLKIEGRKKSGIVAQSVGVVTIDFFSIDELFSKRFVELLYGNINEYYVNKITQRQRNNYNLIKHRADSIQLILAEKEASGAVYIDQNLNLSKMRARVNVERMRKEIEILNLMYAEVLKNLEIAKFTLENQTPLLLIIDKPMYPLKMEKKSKMIMGIVFGIMGGILSFSVLYFIDYYKNRNLRLSA